MTETQATSSTNTIEGSITGQRLSQAVAAFESATPNLANRPGPTQTEVFNQLEAILSHSGATNIVANNTNQTIVISSTDTNTDTDTTYSELTRAQAASNTSTVAGLASGRRLWDAVKAFEEPTDHTTSANVFTYLESILVPGDNVTVVANNQNDTVVISSTGGGGGDSSTDADHTTSANVFSFLEGILVPGDNVTVVANNQNDTITIAAEDPEFLTSDVGTDNVTITNRNSYVTSSVSVTGLNGWIMVNLADYGPWYLVRLTDLQQVTAGDAPTASNSLRFPFAVNDTIEASYGTAYLAATTDDLSLATSFVPGDPVRLRVRRPDSSIDYREPTRQEVFERLDDILVAGDGVTVTANSQDYTVTVTPEMEVVPVSQTEYNNLAAYEDKLYVIV